MTGDTKIWLRLSSSTLAVVDQLRGEKTRSEALRIVIDRGLAASPAPDMPAATDDNVTCKVSREEAWAANMAAWFLESAAASWKPASGASEPARWLAETPSNNVREWYAWATALRHLCTKIGETK